MSIVAFTSEGIKVSSCDGGVTISKAGDSWGDPWPVQDSVISVRDVSSLIRALQQVQSEKSYDRW